jgi:hypothetical protein
MAAYQRKLDLRATWRLSPRQEIRLALSDVLHPDRANTDRYEAPDWRQTTIGTRGGTALRLNFKQNFN